MESEKTKKKSSPKLSQDKLKDFKKALLSKRAEILGDVAGLKEEGLGNASGGGNPTPLHFAELGTDTYNQNFALSRLEHEEEIINLIDEALERIETGEFGTCQECGCQIKVGRLEIAPWLANCVECQEKLEEYN